MYNLNDLRIWVKVVEAHSFTKAAAILGMPVSSVSARVSRLEYAVGTQLLERITRSMRLTESGQHLYLQVSQSLAEIHAATGNLGVTAISPRGRIRITTSSVISHYLLAPIVARFLHSYPLMSINIDVTLRQTNLIEEDIDIGIRVGADIDARLVAKPLGTLRAKLYASAAFLVRHPALRHPSDLANLPWLDMSNTCRPAEWVLRDKAGEHYSLRCTPRLSSSDIDMLVTATKDGLGIANLPELIAGPLLERGELDQVLPEWSLPELEVSLVFPPKKSRSIAHRLFIDYLCQQWQQDAPVAPGKPAGPDAGMRPKPMPGKPIAVAPQPQAERALPHY